MNVLNARSKVRKMLDFEGLVREENSDILITDTRTNSFVPQIEMSLLVYDLFEIIQSS